MSDEPKKLIESAVNGVLTLEKNLQNIEAELSKNEQFRKFLELQKTTQKSIADTWAIIEKQMIEHNVKKLSGDWGSLTIGERTGFNIDKTLLPPRFWKKVPDENKIRITYQLEGKPPKGTEPKITKYLLRRIK